MGMSLALPRQSVLIALETIQHTLPPVLSGKEKMDICRIKVTANVSYQDARKLVDPPYVNNAARPSYASVTKTTRSVETQTDVVRCTCGALSAIEKSPKNKIKRSAYQHKQMRMMTTQCKMTCPGTK